MSLVLSHDLSRTPASQPDPRKPARNSHPPPSTLTSRHARAIELIATGKTLTETARLIGVARETLSGWAHSPAFQQAVQGQILERRAFAKAKLEALVEPALALLEQQLTDPNMSPVVRQRAAITVLDRAGMGANGNLEMEEISESPRCYDLSGLGSSDLGLLMELAQKITERTGSSGPDLAA